jgi:hypothetical protein
MAVAAAKIDFRGGNKGPKAAFIYVEAISP